MGGRWRLAHARAGCHLVKAIKTEMLDAFVERYTRKTPVAQMRLFFIELV
jgi:hypothetical protein